MRILGLDPGMTRLGVSAVTIYNGEPVLLTYGMIENPRDPNDTFNQHLNKGIHQIIADLPKLFDVISPTAICAEIVPVGRLGSNTELVVAAITTAKVLAYQFGIPWYDYGANTVKKQVTGDGRATKVKVRNSTMALFPQLNERHNQLKKQQKAAGEKVEGLPADVFDSVAIAVTGAKKLHESMSEL